MGLLTQIYQDYLLRLVQARDLMLYEITLARTSGSDDGAKSVLESVCRRVVGIPLSVVRHTSPEMLLELIEHGAGRNFNSILIAEMLIQDVELNEKVGNLQEAAVSRFQAFCLLSASFGLLQPEEQIEYRAKLEALAKDLTALSDNPYVRGKIDEYRAKQAPAS